MKLPPASRSVFLNAPFDAVQPAVELSPAHRDPCGNLVAGKPDVLWFWRAQRVFSEIAKVTPRPYFSPDADCR